jgi:membrane protease YdiL (CAAX protease family)
LEVQKIHTNSEHLNRQEPAPWGFWATVGFSCIIAVVYFLSAIVLCIGFIVAAKIRDPDLEIGRFAQSLDSNGLFLAISTCVAAPLVIGLVVLFAKICKNITIKEYLCLNKTGWKNLAKWSLVLLAFAGCSDALSFFMERPIVPEFMVGAYKTAYFTPFLWFALVVAAPLSEEIFFRGFLFKGIENSRIGPTGALIITSLFWSVAHTQYDAYGMVSLFVGGLLLGWARLKSNSIYIPVAMHALMNLIGTIEVVIYLRVV